MTFSFHPEAREEYREAALRYERIKPELGHAFAKAVERAIAALVLNPLRFGPVDERGIRRCLLKRFPYKIHYLPNETQQQLVIYAVMHVSRDADYWKGRLP